MRTVGNIHGSKLRKSREVPGGAGLWSKKLPLVSAPSSPAHTAVAEGRLCTLLLSHSLTTLPRFPYAHIARTRAKALSSM